MNSDLDLLKQFGADLGPPSDQVPEALRRRVLRQPTLGQPRLGRPERIRRSIRSGARWVGAVRLSWRLTGVTAAALALAAVTAVALVGGPPGRPPRPIAGATGGPSAAAQTPTQLLQLAAARVAVAPEPTARPNQFVYLQSVAVYQDIYLDGRWSGPGVPNLVREWRSVDGTHDGIIRRRPLDSPDAAWVAESIPGCRDGTLSGAGRTACTPEPGYAGGLPTTGDAMYGYLYRAGTDNLPMQYAAQITADERAFERAASALSLGQTSPAVQAAVFAALTMVPGVTVSNGVTDVSGRPGVALVHKGPYGTTELIFDPDTYRYLGMTQTLAELASVDKSVNIVLRLVTRQAFQQVSIVDRVGELP